MKYLQVKMMPRRRAKPVTRLTKTLHHRRHRLCRLYQRIIFLNGKHASKKHGYKLLESKKSPNSRKPWKKPVNKSIIGLSKCSNSNDKSRLIKHTRNTSRLVTSKCSYCTTNNNSTKPTRREVFSMSNHLPNSLPMNVKPEQSTKNPLPPWPKPNPNSRWLNPPTLMCFENAIKKNKYGKINGACYRPTGRGSCSDAIPPSFFWVSFCITGAKNIA